MVSMQETAYPRLKSCPSFTELEKLFHPAQVKFHGQNRKHVTRFRN